VLSSVNIKYDSIAIVKICKHPVTNSTCCYLFFLWGGKRTYYK